MLPKHRAPTHPGEILLEEFLIHYTYLKNDLQSTLPEHGLSQKLVKL